MAADQSQLDRWVAIKILNPKHITNKDFLQRFRQEAKAIALLRHPNVLTVYDYGEENGIRKLVCEKCNKIREENK